MESNENKVWFPAKKYGWGWGPPCSWQGWLVYLVWVSLLVTGGVVLAPRSIALYVGYALALGALLFVVVLSKGEKPRWRWGEAQDHPPRSATERMAELDELHRQRRISDAEYQAKRQQILSEM
ncbi:MAG TPA: SHOCT domain-containing protein [Candidatus Acidoferrum sp.]|nr:SHOCT domain-containing protein [Candidatus Acidoferrum sp.]